jgi:GDSL-like lipase/acylhydrolase family protein
MKTSGRRKWAYRVLAVACGMCVAAIACEGILRLVPGLLPSGIYQRLQADPRNYGVAHPYIGHLHTPNSRFVIASGSDFKVVHHTGPYGFRVSAPWPDTVDIAVLGDSVTFGYGVSEEQAWPALLARSLGSRLINLGLIGAGPQQYLRVYQTFGTALHPKLVIVGFFAGNDFSNAETFDRWLNSGVGGNYMVWRDFGQPQRVTFSLRHLASSLRSVAEIEIYPLLRRSYLVNLLRAAREAAASPSAQSELFRLADGREIELSRDDTPISDREFKLTLEALEQIHTTAAGTGAHALIVLQPSKEEVYLPLVTKTEPPDPTKSLREALHSRGIDYLNLAPAFRERAAAGDLLFYKSDGHPNAAGYALIAEQVARYIRENAAKYPEPRVRSH